MNRSLSKLQSGDVAFRGFNRMFDAYLGVNQDADDLAVSDHLVEVIFDGLLSQIIGPLLTGLSESLLLARVPEWFR